MQKRIVLKSYEIKPAETKMLELDLPSLVKSKLEEIKTVNERFMQHSEMDTAEEGDFIGMYKSDKSIVFGSIVRIKRGEANHITLSQLDGPAIRLEEMESSAGKGVAGILKDYGYFCMNKKNLLLTTGHISRKAAQTYFNWLLNKPDGGSPVCIFEPKTKSADDTPISEISSIAISEAFFQNRKGYESFTRDLSVTKSKFLLDMVTDAKSLKDIDLENIISASIRLKIKLGSKSKKTEENKKVLATLFQSAESNDILVSTKNGRKIKGGTFEVKRETEEDITASGFPHEAQLETEMRQFLKDLG